MGVFDRIKSAIFGRRAQAAPSATARATPASGRSAPQPRDAGPAPTATAATPAAGTPRPATPAAVAAPPPMAAVDVEEVLEEIAGEKGRELNWRTSIVDLMKLLDLDSSLENRRELARELGYDGSTADSAAMNVWLHRQVMRRLAENGGRVPANLRD